MIDKQDHQRPALPQSANTVAVENRLIRYENQVAGQRLGEEGNNVE